MSEDRLWRETPLIFMCESEQLVGVLAQPVDRGHHTGVVIIVGGPQYRVGSHRQFVEAARALASSGYPTLRFDVRGMGDASGQAAGFEDLDEDIAAAVDTLQAQCPHLRQTVIWALCDGASAALMYCERRRDPRIVALCLINPWVRSEHTLARTHIRHYYKDRLRQADFWAKLLRGGIGVKATVDLLSSIAHALTHRRDQSRPDATRRSFQDVMASGWRQFKGEVLIVLSTNDYTAKEFLETLARSPAWQGAWARRALRRIDLEGADHTISDRSIAVELQCLVVGWLDELVRPALAPESRS
jgi:exosortase A-associated hydrolase 1